MILLKHKGPRWLLGIFAVAVLVAVYIFQSFDFSALAGTPSANSRFIINRSVRLIEYGALGMLDALHRNHVV